jgi:hypothetical protein
MILSTKGKDILRKLQCCYLPLSCYLDSSSIYVGSVLKLRDNLEKKKETCRMGSSKSCKTSYAPKTLVAAILGFAANCKDGITKATRLSGNGKTSCGLPVPVSIVRSGIESPVAAKLTASLDSLLEILAIVAQLISGKVLAMDLEGILLAERRRNLPVHASVLNPIGHHSVKGRTRQSNSWCRICRILLVHW